MNKIKKKTQEYSKEKYTLAWEEIRTEHIDFSYTNLTLQTRLLV